MEPTETMPYIVLIEFDGETSPFVFATAAQAQKFAEEQTKNIPNIKVALVISIKRGGK